MGRSGGTITLPKAGGLKSKRTRLCGSFILPSPLVPYAVWGKVGSQRWSGIATSPLVPPFLQAIHERAAGFARLSAWTPLRAASG